MFDPTRADARARINEIGVACHEAVKALIADRFASFIEATRTEGSTVFEYFVKAQEEALDPNNRQLVRALDRMREVLSS